MNDKLQYSNVFIHKLVALIIIQKPRTISEMMKTYAFLLQSVLDDSNILLS